MNISELPKLKSSKEKVKQTFCLSREAYEVYVMAKAKGYDSTLIVSNAIEKALFDIKSLIQQSK